MVGVWIGSLLLVVTIGGCTRKNPEYCDLDTDCEDPSKPFCDLAGEYPESGHTRHQCSQTPASCPLERCGCAPGVPLGCDGDGLRVCGGDGMSSTLIGCALGCSTAETRCRVFEPSNDLGPALDMAAAQGEDVVLPTGARIDTGVGLVQDSVGNVLPVTSLLVSQGGGGSMIRVLIGHSFVFDATSVIGPHALAVVAPGQITVRGLIDASATAVTGGPGAQEAPAACTGTTTQVTPTGCDFNCSAKGAGGAGNATAGGAGGAANQPGGLGGALIPTFYPLVGGCRGGIVLNDTGTLASNGGGGGGGIQFVSLQAVAFTSDGFIDVGGGGGQSSAGGGSAGTVVLESPIVRFDAATTGVAANGGSGGGCYASGGDGKRTTEPAFGPVCEYSPGNGGTGATAPGWGAQCSGTCVQQFYGGGGGAAGRLRIVTKDGQYTAAPNLVLSAHVSTAMLVPK